MARHSITRLVEWGDCDPAGIVFYPNFYRWFDQATWALLRACGLPPEVVEARYGSFGQPLVEAWAKFLAPVRPGDALVIDSRVESLARKSLRIRHEARVEETPVAEGYEVRIWGVRDAQEPSRMRAAPIPEEVRAILGG